MIDQNPEIAKFFKEGKLQHWPSKQRDKEAIRKYLASLIKVNQIYSEKEINELFNEHHSFNDPALLRRELCDHQLLKRDKYGTKYWKPNETKI